MGEWFIVPIVKRCISCELFQVLCDRKGLLLPILLFLFIVVYALFFFFTLCPTNALFNCIQNLFLFLFLWIGSGTHLKAFGVAFALATVGDPWPPSVECWKNRLIYLCAWKGRRAGQEKDFLVSSSLCFCCCAYYWLT